MSVDELCGADEAGRLNGISGKTVRRLGMKGIIKIYREGTAVRFDPLEIRALMQKQGEAQPIIPRAPKRT
ncbi:MAG: helix-turn-helix domain-containing protein [Desulfobacterales bacterium]|nr:helix-turn-helix domain-containing protein [Desulfobacterales bacterium]